MPKSIQASDHQKPVVLNYRQQKLRAQELHRYFQASKTTTAENRYIQFITDSLMPNWYGTAWSFYGTTEIPQKGSIACGYFVTTVLRDAGIRLNHVKLAQCASEEMIRQLAIKESISRYRFKPIQLFVEDLLKKKSGLYIVGLDNHTGFLYHNGNELYFIHSTFVRTKSVMIEKAAQSEVLAASKYKVVGRVNLLL